MSIAYCILAHDQPAQLGRLFRVLFHPSDFFAIHIEQRAPAGLHQLAARLAADHANVVVLPSRVLLWGGYQIAATQIEGMMAALRSESRWSHFINLSHRDFPLKTRGEILATLQPYPEANYVEWFDPVQHPRWRNARERLARYYLEWPWLDRFLKIPGIGRRVRRLLGWRRHLPHIPGFRREWPDFFHYYGGANDVILSRAAVHHLIHSAQSRHIREWLRHSAHADEIVFPTVMLNSPLASTVVNDHLREVDFPLNSLFPRTLTRDDLPRLQASPRLFAHPFNEQIDAGVLDRLEHLLNHHFEQVSPDVPVLGRHQRPHVL